MANTTFNGPVRSTKGFQIATRDAISDVETTRMSSGMPDLTGLTLTDTGTATNITLVNKYNPKILNDEKEIFTTCIIRSIFCT